MSDGYTLEDYESELFHDIISDFKGGGEQANSSSTDPDTQTNRSVSSDSETSSGDEVPDITSSGDEEPEISDSEAEEEPTPAQPTSSPMSKVEVTAGPDFDDDAEIDKTLDIKELPLR